MRYHLTHVRIASIIKSIDNKCWQGCGEKGTLGHCWLECRLVWPLWKAIWSILKKIKMELPFYPTMPLLGIYPKDSKTPIKKYMHRYVYSSGIYNSQDLEIA